MSDTTSGAPERCMPTDKEPTVIALNGTPTSGKQIAAVYRCRAKHENLRDTEHPDVRFCEACQQKVFKVVDFDGLERRVAACGCVWGPNDIWPTLVDEAPRRDERGFFERRAPDPTYKLLWEGIDKELDR
jgi:hypothetical protein